MQRSEFATLACGAITDCSIAPYSTFLKLSMYEGSSRGSPTRRLELRAQTFVLSKLMPKANTSNPRGSAQLRPHCSLFLLSRATDDDDGILPGVLIGLVDWLAVTRHLHTFEPSHGEPKRFFGVHVD